MKKIPESAGDEVWSYYVYFNYIIQANHFSNASSLHPDIYSLGGKSEHSPPSSAHPDTCKGRARTNRNHHYQPYHKREGYKSSRYYDGGGSKHSSSSYDDNGENNDNYLRTKSKTKLWVGGLPLNTTVEELTQFFEERYGKVKYIMVLLSTHILY